MTRGKWKNTMDMIDFFSIWDPVSFLHEVTDVIDSHSLFCGLRRMLDVTILLMLKPILMDIS